MQQNISAPVIFNLYMPYMRGSDEEDEVLQCAICRTDPELYNFGTPVESLREAVQALLRGWVMIREFDKDPGRVISAAYIREIEVVDNETWEADSLTSKEGDTLEWS